MNELLPISYNCASCGELNETSVDPTGGSRQSYIEDCSVCCHPNTLQISLFPDGEVSVQVTFEE